jgi:diguanylate cyclase (GGDEF)-like protein
MDNTSESNDALQARIKELETQIKELETDLIHDHLTGLKTRAFFEEETKVYIDAIQSVSKHKRREQFGFSHLSVLFIDIDYFKKINDTFGHAVGDAVLKTVAKTIEGSVREGDTAARWGGEEMVVSLLGANESDACEKAEQIRRAVLELSFPEHEGLTVTVSIGVATAEKGIGFEEMVRRADEALYNAKESGRNAVCTYSAVSKQEVAVV